MRRRTPEIVRACQSPPRYLHSSAASISWFLRPFSLDILQEPPLSKRLYHALISTTEHRGQELFCKRSAKYTAALRQNNHCKHILLQPCKQQPGLPGRRPPLQSKESIDNTL